MELGNTAYSDSGSQSLWKDGERVFRRGWRMDDNGNRHVVLVVLPAAEQPSRSDIDRLVHEYELKDELDGTWAVRPLELVTDAGRTMLVLEDTSGEPLDRLLGTPIEVGRFLRLAIAVAAALGKLHQRGLVHKDIKPANILVNRAADEVRLTGFGIASRLARERQSAHPPETIAGTLAYMAPEQTGRMNRSIDSRSDLYALGVTLYRMLTGALPFLATEPMEWVHCHLARQPVPPAERVKEIPGAVSAIVMKLLAKSAEDRYQTAGGLENDLRRCQREWQVQRRIDEFPLGEYDIPDRLLIPEKLYGRQHEVETLHAAFHRVANGGAPELVLVSGYSGIGKSSVVNELQPALVPPRGLFASGKFDQYSQDIPYSTLGQAFQSLIRPLLGKSEAELAPWREALRETLGSNAGLIVDIVPEVKLIIGRPPPVPELPPLDAQRRFQLVFRRFIGVFARPEHPLALFLDDLQWLDAATLDLLEDLLSESELRNLLLIGAFRDNEVTPTHPLMRKLEVIRTTGRVHDIKLGPLTNEDMAELVADTLRCDAEPAAPLAELLRSKTDGNPFFVMQFLRVLADEGLLAFDHARARWDWDLGGIHAKRYTDNVVELLAGKLTRLSLNTQETLQQLACLGNITDVSVVSIVLAMPEEQVHPALEEALRQQLVDRLDRSYKFVHDRVQEAAYALIPEELRAAAHLRIGRLLLACTPLENRDESIFDIVNHLNRGAALITSHDERDRLAELNLSAGKRAKGSAAYASALKYLIAGADLLDDDRWECRRDLTFALELGRAECEFLTRELEAADERLSALSSHAANTIERATLASLRINVCLELLQPGRAVGVCLDYLRHEGIEISPHPTEDEVRREYERIWLHLGSRTIEEVVNLPLMSDPESLATLNVLLMTGIPAAITDENLNCWTICRAVNLSLERGNCDASCLAYAVLSRPAVQYFRDYTTAFRFGKVGLELVDSRGLNRFEARTCTWFAALSVHWMRRVRDCVDLLHRGSDAANKAGDFTFVNFANLRLTLNLLIAGEPLSNVQRQAELGLTFASKAQFSGDFAMLPLLALIRTLRGLTPKFGCLDCGKFEELPFERLLAGNPYLRAHECWYWVRKIQARYLAGDYPMAMEASANLQRLIPVATCQSEEAEYHFYSALSCAAFCDSAAPEERRQHFERLAEHQRLLEIWAENCPENFENRAALVGAEIARIENRDLDAMRLYEKAIQSSRTNGFVNNEALAYERASAFYAARGMHEIAHLYIGNARSGYLRWGADGKVRQLDQLHPGLRSGGRVSSPTGTIAAPVEQLDLATVIKVSQAVSGEMALERLIDRLMRTAIEYAGAERGMLINQQGEELQIDAEAIANGEDVVVQVRECSAHIAVALPESLIRYSIRTQETVILDEASTQNAFTGDPYIAKRRARSILCLPLIYREELSGILYLENNLAPRVFTPDRVTVLKVLASQAAMSLENSRLYRELGDRERKIRRLVDANIIGIFVADLNGRIIEANDAFLGMLGYDREDLIASRVHWTELSPPEWRKLDSRTLAELLSTGTVQPFEKEYFHKDGRRVPVLIGGALLKEGGNETVAFVLDLTERKRAEEALRESEYELRQIVDAVPGIVWSADPNGKLTHVNRRLLDNSGMRFEEFMQSGWEQAYMHPADLEDATERYRRAIQTGNSYDVVLRLRRADGEFRWHRIFCEPLHDREGRIIQWYGLSVDIDEAKKAEDQLRRSEAWLTQAQRLSHTGTRVFNPATSRYSYWSDENYRIWGFDPLQGVPSREDIWQRVHPDDHNRVWEAVQRAVAQKSDLTIEHRILLPDGTIKHLEAIYHMFSMLNAPGEVFITTADVTQRRLAQDEREKLRQLESEIAHMNRVSVMGELAASLSHEILHPIATARNNARAGMRFLEMKPPNLDEAREALGCVVRDADRAKDIVGRMRDQIKKAPPHKERFNLNDAINEVIVLAGSTISRNAVSTRTRLTDGLFAVQGDRVQLQQVLLNLILNAVEAMGLIEAGTRELLVSTEQDHAGVLVAVRDSGPGIDPGNLERVFEPFYTTKTSGIGMGLSICRSIINGHGGRLWAAPNEPRGTVFQFTLPGAQEGS